MAYVAPALGTAGQVYTAAAHNIIVNDILQFAPMVQGVFTNEAARDAAITSPTEGMHAYLTAPTVPAAVGGANGTAAVPLGVQTIYNGFVWVCVTPVGANTNQSGTLAGSGSFSTTMTGDATAVSATLVTGTTVRIDIFAEGVNSSAAGNFLTYSVSGATTVAAGLGNGAWSEAAANIDFLLSRGRIITGLTAGTNTFTLNYRTDTSTIFLTARSLMVTGIA